MPARPGTAARSFRFNHVIGVDLFEIKDHQNVSRLGLNTVCWGTSLQDVVLVDNKTPSEVLRRFSDSWRKHFGLSDVLVADQGEEFSGTFSSTWVTRVS